MILTPFLKKKQQPYFIEQVCFLMNKIQCNPYPGVIWSRDKGRITNPSSFSSCMLPACPELAFPSALHTGWTESCSYMQLLLQPDLALARWKLDLFLNNTKIAGLAAFKPELKPLISAPSAVTLQPKLCLFKTVLSFSIWSSTAQDNLYVS